MSAGLQLLEGCGGRLLLFSCSLPGTPTMKLLHRDDVRQYGTDKEKALLAPADAAWGELAKKLAAAHVCTSTFHFQLTPTSYVDVATQAVLSRHTGGQLYLYPGCTLEAAGVWGTKLRGELHRHLTRPFGYEGVMRVRCSKGLRVEEYLMGHARVGDVDVDVPGIDADSAFAVTFKHEETLPENSRQDPCLQCALLYTNGAGQRRIRVITLGLKATSQVSSLYRYADLEALTNVMLRQAVLGAAKHTLHQVREAVVAGAVSILHHYRKTCASTTSTAQLILPESLKLLPLYSLAMVKNAVMRAGT